ncbi:hypothetical protein [Myxosarcina sp. GI1]|uniref:hypothetical protein n=1 Tax=Myxosarcina sp. GI1 TaxID=1541065 RepID=UPI000564DC9A|nr:hypothetical protein [Myxosarcina sp. GI1]
MPGILFIRKSLTALSASGQGGNLELKVADSLLLRNGSSISAEARRAFVNQNSNINGGNININADTVSLLENSNINANAFEGNGGNIDITTQALFTSSNSQISASSQFGLDGTVKIDKLNEDRVRQPIVVEAQQWQLNKKGNVVLVAAPSLIKQSNSWLNAHHCLELM